jgi:hypothetical protein
LGIHINVVLAFEALNEIRLLKVFTFFDDGLSAVALEFCKNTRSVVYVCHTFGESLLEAVRRDEELFLGFGERVVDPRFYLCHEVVKIDLVSSAQAGEGPLARTTTPDLILTLLSKLAALS